MTMDPDEVTCRPQLIRTYIICPDCGRSAPDADGRCQDCHDAQRLRDAVGEWARAIDAARSNSVYSDGCYIDDEAWEIAAEGYMQAAKPLLALAHELGLVPS